MFATTTHAHTHPIYADAELVELVQHYIQPSHFDKDFEEVYDELNDYLETNQEWLIEQCILVQNERTLYRGGIDHNRMSWSDDKNTSIDFANKRGRDHNGVYHGKVFEYAKEDAEILCLPIPRELTKALGAANHEVIIPMKELPTADVLQEVPTMELWQRHCGWLVDGEEAPNNCLTCEKRIGCQKCPALIEHCLIDHEDDVLMRAQDIQEDEVARRTQDEEEWAWLKEMGLEDEDDEDDDVFTPTPIETIMDNIREGLLMEKVEWVSGKLLKGLRSVSHYDT